jgi:hypothetical protein
MQLWTSCHRKATQVGWYTYVARPIAYYETHTYSKVQRVRTDRDGENSVLWITRSPVRNRFGPGYGKDRVMARTGLSVLP